MTISDKLNYLSETKTAIKNAIIEKGIEVSDTDTFRSYAEKISAIESGSADNYLGRIVTEDGTLQFPTTSYTFTMPDNITKIGTKGLYYAFYGNAVLDELQPVGGIAHADLSSVKSIGSYGLCYAFAGCANLQIIDLSNLENISDYGLYEAFSGSRLTSINLGAVTDIGSYGLYSAFYEAEDLSSVDLGNLFTIGLRGLEQAFARCTELTSLSFPSLNSNSFGNTTNIFHDMCQYISGCTVHFPSNLESVIGGWSDVLGGFGGMNTTVLFDLPATT